MWIVEFRLYQAWLLRFLFGELGTGDASTAEKRCQGGEQGTMCGSRRERV
jgi:hypothetical protein